MLSLQQWRKTSVTSSLSTLILYLLLTESVNSNIVLPPLPTTGYQVYLDGVGVISQYYQVTDAQIDSMRGLWCLASEGLAEPTWIDPDNNALPNNQNTTVSQLDGSEIQIVYVPGAGLGLFAPNNSIDFGYYICRGQNLFAHYVFIADSTDPPVPLLTDAPPTCTVTSYAPIQNSQVVIGVGITTDINNGGAPTNVTCSLITAGGQLTLFNTVQRPDTVNETFIGTQYVVDIDRLAGNTGVTCFISNTAGISQRNFTCPVQNIPSHTLNVTCTRRDSTMTVEWEATPNTFEGFIAFSVGSDGTRSNGVSSSVQAVFTNLSPSLSYEACVIAIPSMIDTSAIVAPLNIKMNCEGNPLPSPSPSPSPSMLLSPSPSLSGSNTPSLPLSQTPPSPLVSNTPSHTPSPSPSPSLPLTTTITSTARSTTTVSLQVVPSPTPSPSLRCQPGRGFQLQFKLRVSQCREDDFNEIVRQAIAANKNLRERCLTTTPSVGRRDFVCREDRRRGNFRLTLNALVVCDECKEEQLGSKEKSKSGRGKRSKSKKDKSKSKSKKGKKENNKSDKTNSSKSRSKSLFKRKLKVGISLFGAMRLSVEIESYGFTGYYCRRTPFNTQTSCRCPNQCRN